MGRHALVVGGARGIGRGIAAALLAKGWSVTIAGRASRAEELEAQGAVWRALDASDPEEVQSLAAELPPVDALVMAAGPYHRTPFFKETVEGWRSMFANNLDPVFFLSQALMPGMRKRGWGRVVTFSMANAHKLEANPKVAAHSIAKVGVLTLTRTLARIGASRGVTANCISPGFVDSGSAPSEELEAMAPRIPAQRIGTVDDCVAAALYLLSEDAGYVTGANLQVSGGWGL